MVLCQGLPRCLHLCVDPFMARHAQSLNSSLHAWPQNLEAFQTTRKRAKKGQNVISSSVQHPISLIFAIHVSLIIPLPMMWILLTKPMQKSVTIVCLHCSFARLKNKHIGVLGTNVATMSWLHWSPMLDICSQQYKLIFSCIHFVLLKTSHRPTPCLKAYKVYNV